MSMRTQCSLPDLAILAALVKAPLEKMVLARQALAVAEGPTFDAVVALASVDRLAGFGLVRKVRSKYELTQDGRDALTMALQDHRDALEALTRLVSPRLVEAWRAPDGRAAA
jgi:hypothetical protein